MYGQITRFDQKIGVGIIESENARKYRFKASDLMTSGGFDVGYDVAFELDHGKAAGVLVMAGSAWTVFGPATRN